MNISRLAALAVILMMVLSTFVAIPAYNVSAEHDNHDDDDHDHDHGDDEEHGNEDEPDMVCYDFDNHVVDFSITTQEECNEAGFMWTPSNSGPNGDDREDENFRFENLDVVFEMENLNDWNVKIQGNYPVEQSDRFREDVADYCESLGGNSGEITEKCYELFVAEGDNSQDPVMVCYDMQTHEIDFSITSQEECDAAGLMWVDINSGPDGGDHDDHGYCYDTAYHEVVYDISQEDCYGGRYVWVDENDHDGHGDWNCPPGLTEDECEMMEECLDNNMVGMSCNRMMYDYCNDNPNHCDSHNDEGNFYYVMFAYEDGDITAEEFMSNNAIQSMFNHGGDHDDHDDCDYYYGENEDRCYFYDNPGLYQMDYINVSVDQEISIHSNFESSYIAPPSFICGDGTEIDFVHVNNNTVDCEDGADEQWYDSNTPDDTSDDCQEAVDEDCEGEPVNWFDCHDGTQVWIYQVNDGSYDCEDGEDELWSYDTWNYWYGYIYLLEGEHDYIPGPSYYGNDLTPDEVFAVEVNYCDWTDTDKTSVDCSIYIKADLVSNQVYTLVTMTECNEGWGYLDCENFGIYNHTMVYEDGSETNISGEIYSSPYGFCGNCWDYGEEHSDFVQNSAANFSNELDSDGGSYDNFLLYSTEAFVVGADGFEGYMISSGYTCDELGNGSDDCYGSHFEVFLYDAFDTTDTFSGIINMSDSDYNDDWDCAIDYCDFKYMDLDLDEGDYVIVTVTGGHFGADVVLNNSIFDFDGSLITFSSFELRNAYYEYVDGEKTLVTGDERLHFPDWYDWMEQHYYDNHDPDGTYALTMEFRENMTAYEDGDMNATTAADNILVILYAMVDAGFFDHGEAHEDGHHDDHHDDVYWSQWNYCEWEGDSSLQEGDMRWYCTDNDDGTNGFDDWWYYCEAHDDGMDGTTYFCTDNFGQSADYENSASNDHYVTGGTPDGYHDANHHGDEMWYCEDCNCQDTNDAAGYGEAPDGYRQCGGHDGDDNNSPPTPQEVLSWGDANNDSLLSFDEFVATWIAQGDGENDDHHDDEGEGHHHHGDDNIHHEHDDGDGDHTHSDDDRHHSHDDSDDDSNDPELEEAMAMYNESDSNGDGLLNLTEIDHLIQLIVAFNEDHDDHGDDSYNFYDYCNDSGDNYECYMDHWEDHNEEYNYEDCAELEDEWVCEGDPDQHRDHDDHDEHDSDDNPALLDGIIGTQDPEDAGDNCRPSADDPHLLGSVDDNAGHPLTCTFEFKLHFEGVDESLDSHEAYIPFQAQDVWTLKMENALGYEISSCDNCVMGDDGVMTGTGPVNLTLSKVEPQPDCDYVVGLSADGMAFDPVKLAINVGETVCWQWKDAAMAHNVVELEGEYDSTSNLTAIDFGFNSGDPAMTVDFRHTFSEDNKVHYYVCAPHAQLGMVGQVTVGNVTEDPVQQALEDNEVPSIGFVVGSLVLVGAAGLRRRIH